MLVSLDLLWVVGYWLLGMIAVNSQMGPRSVVHLVAVLAAVSIAVCRRWVLLGYGAALAGQLVALVYMVNVANDAAFWLAFLATPPMAYALFRIGARHRLGWAVVGWLPTLAYPIAVLVVDRSIGPVFPIALALTPVLLIGYVEGRRHQETVRYHSGLASSARDRAQLAVAEERIRIARDLHDVVSHGLSVITVQAGSGRLAINESTQEAKDALDAVETTGRQTLGEMRQMLGVLRADEDPLPRDPAPGLAEVHQLIAQLGQAGVEVDLAVSGPAAALTPGVDTAAYRIVQEALTNVARHARTDTCQVRLEYGSESVVVEVIDDGRGSPPEPTGLGLTGMRERAQACGGQLEVRPMPGRGFRVTARLPLTTRPPAAAPPRAATSTPTGRTGLRGSVRDRWTKKLKGSNRRRVLTALTYALAIGTSAFLLLVLTISSWISYGVKDGCREGRAAYGGDCVEALVDLLNDEHRSYRSRNDAVWILGELRDRRALPALQSYYTGNIPPREPLDKTISQYELRKAIRLINGETKTILFWQYD